MKLKCELCDKPANPDLKTKNPICAVCFNKLAENMYWLEHYIKEKTNAS